VPDLNKIRKFIDCSPKYIPDDMFEDVINDYITGMSGEMSLDLPIHIKTNKEKRGLIYIGEAQPFQLSGGAKPGINHVRQHCSHQYHY